MSDKDINNQDSYENNELDNSEKNQLICSVNDDTETDLIPLRNVEKLAEEEKSLVNQIIEASSRADLDKQFELFNINQSKKSALRIIKLNNLLSKVEDQAISRFERRPDQISNKELLDYLNVVSNQIEKAQANVDNISLKQPITVSATKNEVNINVAPELNKESREKVIDIVSALLAQANAVSQSHIDSNNDVIDADFIENNSKSIDETDES